MPAIVAKELKALEAGQWFTTIRDLTMRARLLIIAVVVHALGACALVSPPPELTLAQAIAAPERTSEFRARDRHRHPQPTLEFFGVQPQMTVVEVWPSPGWYTEILAPYLRARGRYIAAGFAVSPESAPEWRRDMMKDFRAKLGAQPGRYDRAHITELGAPDRWIAAPAGSADLLLSFRNVHNWVAGGYERDMFKAFYAALKRGSTLGIVEHRAKPGTSLEVMKKSGYITEALVIQLAEDAGFSLDAKSEINANPKDTRNHPEGVWTLPPTLKLGTKDRQKYLDIGESDRMTLRFVKHGA